MVIFVAGGAKSGKSMLAQCLAKSLTKGGDLLYLATMIPQDGEDRARIAGHLQDREGWGFRTEEHPFFPEHTTAGAADSVLLDSVTAVLQNLMFAPQSPVLPEQVLGRLNTSLELLCAKAGGTVVVSDWIFSDAKVYEDLTLRYRSLLGRANRQMARLADCVIEVTYGAPVFHKGQPSQLAEGMAHYAVLHQGNPFTEQAGRAAQ